jgi:hypothetical protein
MAVSGILITLPNNSLERKHEHETVSLLLKEICAYTSAGAEEKPVLVL